MLCIAAIVAANCGDDGRKRADRNEEDRDWRNNTASENENGIVAFLIQLFHANVTTTHQSTSKQSTAQHNAEYRAMAFERTLFISFCELG